MSARAKSKVPTWLVGLAVVFAVVAAVFFARRKQLPVLWPQKSDHLPLSVQHLTAPPRAIMPRFPRVVSKQRGPTIRAGAVAQHTDRGTCTRCHTIVTKSGAAMPVIRAQSSLPHQYPGGVCTNCHTLKLANSVRQVAARRPIVPKVPREGEWLGAEVVPITALTAKQFGVPAQLAGVVVSEVEAQAATAGIKAGDVITAVNDAPVATMQGFIAATQRGKLGGGAVKLWRKGQTLAVWLGSRPAATAPRNQPSALPSGPKRF